MESKLKYYLEIADNAHVLAMQLGRVKKEGKPYFHSIIDDEYIQNLEGLANQIYIQASKIPSESQVEVSLWLSGRKSNEFYNCLLVEIDNSEYYKVLVRHLFFDTFNYLYLLQTAQCQDNFLNELSQEKLGYFNRRMLNVQNHILNMRECPSEVKLKIQEAVLDLWKYVPDMFQASSADILMLSRDKGVNLSLLGKNWEDNLSILLRQINVALPKLEENKLIGKEGQHTKNLDHLIKNFN